MFRSVKISFFTLFSLLILSFSTVAQNAPVSGTVLLNGAPVEGATVEVYRIDINGSGPAAKTDKKGYFNFAGLMIGATYVLSISAPGAEPQFLPGIKAGTANLKFELKEGDGRRLTPEEVREASAQVSAGGGGELTEDQKKAQAEYQKKVKEVNEKNAKIEQETKVIEASLKEGNDAYSAKNWDLAISKYETGIQANPTFSGSAPVLMNNKGAALRERAVKTYNENVRNTEVSAKVAAFGKVKADLGEAAETYHKSWNLLKNSPAGEIADPKIKESGIATAVRGAADTFRLMALTEQVDETKIEIAKEVLPEYEKIETDAAKKASSKLILGDLYRVTGDADNAIAEYRKVVEGSPDNLDGLAGLGLSLVNAGYINNNKEQLQEGANYLQKYSSSAPDGHKYKADALGLIESLKAEQKITPQKVAPARRRGN